MSVNEIPTIDRLTGPADLTPDDRETLAADYARALRGWWPAPFGAYFRERYRIDPTAVYAGRTIDHPFGKGSGQLSMTPHQIRDSAEAGLAFVVLKTVIGEDATGARSMGEWVTTDTRMVVEPIVGQSGRSGWTVTWKGRGWGRSFEDYLDLCRESFGVMASSGMVVAPSAKLHLPSASDEPWRVDEYRHVLSHLGRVWSESGLAGPMPMEKDFSPTLAGDNRARSIASVERWLSHIVPRLREAAKGPTCFGVKLMNFVGPVDVQRHLLSLCLEAGPERRPDFLVYANRLFDPAKTFEGRTGVAYGGPDLSDRNLAMLSNCREAVRAAGIEISATGDVDTGRTAVEYALRGCSSVQIHTGFQVALEFPPDTTVSRLRRALARLVFHPEEGLVAWMLHAKKHWDATDEAGLTRWLDLPGHAPEAMRSGR